MKKALSLFLAALLLFSAAGAVAAAVPASQTEETDILAKYGIEITVTDAQITSADRFSFEIYTAISNICRTILTISQGNNPEVFCDKVTKLPDYVRVYMTCEENASKEKLRESVEEYTDLILAVLQASFPKMNLKTIAVCWKIPAIDRDSLYSATYTCENDGSAIVRGEGKGALYGK